MVGIRVIGLPSEFNSLNSSEASFWRERSTAPWMSDPISCVPVLSFEVPCSWLNLYIEFLAPEHNLRATLPALSTLINPLDEELIV